MDTKEKYVEKSKAEIDLWNAKIDEMLARVNLRKEEARESFRDHLSKMKEKRAEAAEKLDEIEDSSGEAWERIKEGAGKIRDDFHETAKKVEEALARD